VGWGVYRVGWGEGKVTGRVRKQWKDKGRKKNMKIRPCAQHKIWLDLGAALLFTTITCNMNRTVSCFVY
jgi:hypothetical protein